MAVSRPRRLAMLAASAVVALGVSLSWPLIVDLTPASSRPHVGDTRNNSALSLALGSKGVANVTGTREGPRGGPGMGPPGAPPRPQGPEAGPGMPPPGQGPGGGPGEITGHGGRPGPFRLVNRELAGHIAWLFPLAVFGAITARPRRGAPFSSSQVLVIVWVMWFAAYAGVFSFARAPIHPYYLTVLGPAVASLASLGACAAWKTARGTGIAIAASALWQIAILTHFPGWARWLAPVLIVGTAMAIAWILIGRKSVATGDARERMARAGALLGLATLLICPAAWSAMPLLAPGARMVPIADPALLRHPALPGVSEENRNAIDALAGYLKTQRGGERFLAACSDIHFAAPIIIATGQPVMAYGGFGGRDSILTAEQFAAMVRAGEVRFVLLPPGGPRGRMQGDGEDVIAQWVRAHGREVPPHLWRPALDLGELPPSGMAGWGDVPSLLHRAFAGPGLRLYDCFDDWPSR
jgi:4-amino-4-deoxy-L-arabinose transferase-like glycosyltransferase